jgi:hypothetical protein
MNQALYAHMNNKRKMKKKTATEQTSMRLLDSTFVFEFLYENDFKI